MDTYHHTDRSAVTPEMVAQAIDERKRIPDDNFKEVLKWIPIPTSDFVLTRTYSGGKREFMLGRRAEPPFQDTWFVPGGRLNFGETVEEACLRHLKRELGITGIVPRFVGHLSVMNPESSTRPLWHSIWHLHEVVVPHDMPMNPNGENKELRWFTEIDQSFPDPVKAALAMLGFV